MSNRWLTVLVTVDLSSPSFAATSIRETPGDCHRELMMPAVLLVRLNLIDKALVSKNNLTQDHVIDSVEKNNELPRKPGGFNNISSID